MSDTIEAAFEALHELDDACRDKAKAHSRSELRYRRGERKTDPGVHDGDATRAEQLKGITPASLRAQVELLLALRDGYTDDRQNGRSKVVLDFGTNTATTF